MEDGAAVIDDLAIPLTEKEDDLDDLLDDIATGIDTTSQDVIVLNKERNNR